MFIVFFSFIGVSTVTGLVEGLDGVGWSDVPIVAVETDGAASLAATMKADSVVTISGITR